MVILGGWVFLMSEVPLYREAAEPGAGRAAERVDSHQRNVIIVIKSRIPSYD